MLRTLVACLLLATAAIAAPCEDLSIVNWMHGDWATDDGRARESWTRLSDATWEGKAQVGATVESLRMLAMGGEIFYLAKVDHNEDPTVFRLVECGENRAVFANPAHDFPSRLEYALKDDGVLSVHVTGKDGEGFRLRFLRSDASR